MARSVATKQSKTAVVIALHGNLGGGKTTFLQGFAKGLGIKEKILSPTFIIYRKFCIPKNGRSSILTNKRLFHFDCYRINKSEEILELGFKEIISNPENIVAIEWPEKIKKYLPKNFIKINFTFVDEKTREINIKT
ncbi:MAG: tRNA (adenosine(37)-N6)-threonylcarbamoyltransferase complex ATPase subunit type 1 TsaE [Candidatus Staskawiczbacteria bacterium RIFOXYB1_FULL_37_44]|uniref:tRNA threonylcarbamoyladenosine biosynthesis protein TsaE n=1 Tax=Candidatus Staskawiczbacteria bacterium RIFOXYB1_FULL_37_44 TaxID=1802223 RepID=A0A1G2IXX6_9BACT|nr:MAG: tRNA (adenosine(37)-N6)-threonylcarbamoyltransferase complex ATPase subunit type 1 TsaE [Candidatus Staskawiczbacteria bacterium RIFOXYB1_FULL_37_44]OGZ83999.1 MAG: tRNA (adenosine(37)-N6)-threonylcarbamoyltransferase complex ATPase subunit type 1 TsaE [Candidatus Staskawiczbacteria bacterium RIFOXYC1_FULL_37_52]OGZ87976.1 MAG: tRNA (adenosine(37)-N6)-threonylcarbamoyltransferase complex ATPase subunit type 1 TsaE [Candidatus Staskawiczbacteria bacterium RIFOXYC2_FULL_37_19]OGZ89569.1 MA